MRVIIAGSRGITDYNMVKRAVKNSGFRITTILSGACPKGVDQLAIRYAIDNKIPYEEYPAKWNENGYFDKGAGYTRNYEMALNADALIAIWDGESRGTEHMIRMANSEMLEVFLMKEVTKEESANVRRYPT